MNDFIRLADDGDAFIVTHEGERYEIPFARLVETMAFGDSVSFSGAFYPEGWGWMLRFDGLEVALVAQVAEFARSHFARPWVGREVEFDELTSDPDAYDTMLVHVVGPMRITADGAYFGDATLELPARGAGAEIGASLRKVSGFWDARESRLQAVYIKPSLTEPHARCTSGPTRSLILDGDVVVDGSTPLGPRLIGALGRGKYAGLTFEHPICQWFEEYRSISIFTWVSWLMGDEEMRSCASWEFRGVEDLSRDDGWGLMSLPAPVVHPGVLRSSARALESLLDWTAVDRETAVYGAGDVVLDGRDTSYRPGQVVPGDEADDVRRSESVSFGLGAAAIRTLLDGALPEPALDPSQARFVRGAFETPHTDPRNMIVSVFPVPPPQLRSPSVDAGLLELWGVAEKGAKLMRIPSVPPELLRNEIARLQDAADVAYGAIIARLWHDD